MHLNSVLVAGCGGTGSEIIKLLLQQEFDFLYIIDNDKIEISNLNRQFFFSKNDVGYYKSQVIYKKINSIKKVKYFICKVEELPEINFDFVFCCLDNLSSRMAVNLLNYNVMIDLGVEGNKCHVKKVIKQKNKEKYMNSCLYCIKELYNNDDNFVFCTQRNINTLENRADLLKFICIKYESILQAIENFNEIAKEKNYKLTDQIEIENIKFNIIPNVCFINSICASLAFLILEDKTNDFYFYNGISVFKTSINKNKDCFVCN